MRNRRIVQKILRPMIAVALAVSIGSSSTSDAMIHAVEEPLYVSEICLFQGTDVQTAAKECVQKGYIPVQSDLKQSVEGDCLVLGYHTTKDRSKAITDLSMLQMGIGYEEYSYAEVVEQQAKDMGYFANDFLELLDDFQANLENGSPAAKSALELYNLLYVDEAEMRLGDYLISGKCDAQFITKLLTRSTSYVLNTLYAAMVAGVADYHPDSVYQAGEYVIEVPLETTDTVIYTTEMTETAAAEITTETEAVTDISVLSAEMAETTDASAAETNDVAFAEITEISETQTSDASTEMTTVTETTLPPETTTTTVTTTVTLNDAQKVEIVLNCDMAFGTWADRVSKTGMVQYLADEDVGKEFDDVFQSVARNLTAAVQDFSAKYQDANARRIKKGEEAIIPEVEADSVEEVPQEIAADVEANAVNTAEDADLFYLVVYDKLATYPYDDQKTLAEYLVEAGNRTYALNDELRELYPLAAALTDAQAYMMQMNGVGAMVSYLSNDGTLEEQASSSLEELRRDIQSEMGTDCISVWEGVNQAMFSESIAMTSDMIVKQNAGQVFKQYHDEDEMDVKISELMTRVNFASQIIGAVSMVVSVGMRIAGTALTYSVCTAAIAQGGVLSFIGGVVGLSLWALGYVTIVAMVVYYLYKLCKWIYDQFRDDKDDIEYTPIPEKVFDIRDGEMIHYSVVRNLQNEPQDLNGGNGKRWNALYYTTAGAGGSPLCADELENVFLVQCNTTEIPCGYTALNSFNEAAPANLNANCKGNAILPVFLYYHTENDLMTPINEGEQQADRSTRYLSGIQLSCEETESAAKTALVTQGYSVMEVNLTPGIERCYTYLGYTTTNNVNSAIRDIRVAARNNTENFLYGNASYGLAGTTRHGDSIYYTSYPSAGSPIMEGLQLVHSVSEAPAGYEPVSLFNGMVYNFNRMEDRSYLDASYDLVATVYKDYDRTNFYLYFNPSVHYTAETENGPATKYIGGLAVLVGRSNKENPKAFYEFADRYANNVGGTLIPCQLNDGIEMDDTSANFAVETTGNGPKNPCRDAENMESYLCYTTTYNPQRAIYDIKSYTAAPQSLMLNPFMGSDKQGAYAVCDVLCELYVIQRGQYHVWTGYTMTHDYLNTPQGAGDGLTDDRTDMKPEDFEMEAFWDAPYSKAKSHVSWEASALRCKGLYLQGATEGKLPLTSNDIMVLGAAADALDANDVRTLAGDVVSAAEFTSVQDAKTPNATTPHNLGYRSLERSCGECYIYLRRNVQEKQYISSIYAASYDMKTTAKQQGFNPEKIKDAEVKALDRMGIDTCIYTLLMTCQDEIMPYDISCYNEVQRYEAETSWYDPVLTKLAYVGSALIGFVGWESGVTTLDQYQWEYYQSDNYAPWQEDCEEFLRDQCSYIGVTRTATQSEAITGIIKFKPESGEPAAVIEIEGAEYHRCGDKIVDPVEGAYYLYTTKDSCANPGVPITGIDFSSVPIVKGAATAMTGTKTDTKTQLAPLSANSHCLSFIHTYYSDADTYIEAVYVGHGKTMNEALCNLIDLGCNNALMMNLNQGIEGEYVFLGFTKYKPKKTDKKKKNAVRDVVMTVGEPPQTTLECNGMTYHRAIDEWMLANDTVHGVSINSGTDAPEVYLYYTAETSTALQNGSPITQFAAAERDRIPDLQDGVCVWENLLTTAYERYNLNDGLVGFSDDGKELIDSRLFLFAKREDDSTKVGAAIVGGHCEEMTAYGELYQKKN